MQSCRFVPVWVFDFLACMGCFGKRPCCSFLAFSGACFRALVLMISENCNSCFNQIFSSRGCLGCCIKPAFTISVDDPSKGLRNQGRSVKKPSFSEDFWSTSTMEMENSGLQSQRSIPSINIPNHGPDPQSTSSSYPNEFVNHGLNLWNQTRHEWIGSSKSQKTTQSREARISWNATYETLLGTNKPFPQPIPLSEMIEFLVDIWEQEGLYD